MGVMQIPFRKTMPWQEDTSQKVLGLNPGAAKGFFRAISELKCICIVIILLWNVFITFVRVVFCYCLICICGKCSTPYSFFIKLA